jgi:hypothetical protein
VTPDGSEAVISPDEVLTGPAGEAVAADGVGLEPAKVLRIGSMVKTLLDEVRQAPLDEKSSFTHLHTHTEFSMLDGAARVGDLVAAAAADGQPALGITDHGNMYGVLDFYKACRAGHHPDHRHRGLHGRRVPPRAARCAGARSTTPGATPRAGRSSTTT